MKIELIILLHKLLLGHLQNDQLDLLSLVSLGLHSVAQAVFTFPVCILEVNELCCAFAVRFATDKRLIASEDEGIQGLWSPGRAGLHALWTMLSKPLSNGSCLLSLAACNSCLLLAIHTLFVDRSPNCRSHYPTKATDRLWIASPYLLGICAFLMLIGLMQNTMSHTCLLTCTSASQLLMLMSLRELIWSEGHVADAATQQAQFGRIRLTLACKAAAVEVLHAAATTAFHSSRILKFKGLVQSFHDLVISLRVSVGPQLTAGTTLLHLCWGELSLKHNTDVPTSDAALGSNFKMMLRNKTLSLIVLAIVEAILVMTLTSHNVEWLNAPTVAHSVHVKYLHQATTSVSHAAMHTH